MTDIRCSECKSTDNVEWTETDAENNMMVFEPNTYYCYDCGETFLVNMEEFNNPDNPNHGLKRNVQKQGNEACKYRFWCRNYNKDCRCKYAYVNNYEPMGIKEMRALVKEK